MVAIDMEMPRSCFGNKPCSLANGETSTCKKRIGIIGNMSILKGDSNGSNV